MMFIGNAIYIALEISQFPKRYWLLIGRLITGIGSGLFKYIFNAFILV